MIDLRPADFTEGSEVAGGGLSYIVGEASGRRCVGGFSIAGDFTEALVSDGGFAGVRIENASSGSGDDMMTGNEAANVLTGNDGNDRIRGKGGDDAIDGGAGDDLIRSGDGADRVNAGAGNDKVVGGDGDDMLLGDAGLDILNGEAGNDSLEGGAGRDKIFGGGGDDVLIGGGGNDVLRGNGGADVFEFFGNFGRDKIKRFEDDRDTLVLDDALWGGGLSKIRVLRKFGEEFTNKVMLDFGGGEKIIITGLDHITDLRDDLVFI